MSSEQICRVFLWSDSKNWGGSHLSSPLLFASYVVATVANIFGYMCTIEVVHKKPA